MRMVGNPPIPTTSSTLAHNMRIASVIRTYPETLIRGAFNSISGKTVKFSPMETGKGVSCSRFLFEIGDESRHIRIEDEWTINLSTTSINLTTNTGGHLDGLSYVNGAEYLVWAFLDDDYNWAGIGATKKPSSSFSAIAGGSANKGMTKNFTVSDAYQFTIGSRVAVRNDVGTAPFYEWNWATVNSIVSGTVISLAMDNNSAYGTNITGTTNGYIKQWNKFRPYVVSGGAQNLYKNRYSLVGELYTDGTSGDIIIYYRADEEWRALPEAIINYQVGVGVNTYSGGRDLPLWTNAISGFLHSENGAAGDIMFIGSAASINQIPMDKNKGTSSDNDSGTMIPTEHAITMLDIFSDATATVTCSFKAVGYAVRGGMRP